MYGNQMFRKGCSLLNLPICVLQSWSRQFSCVCTSITVVIPLPIQCGSDPIPNPLGPAFASLSYLIFAIATVQLVSRES